MTVFADPFHGFLLTGHWWLEDEFIHPCLPVGRDDASKVSSDSPRICTDDLGPAVERADDFVRVTPYFDTVPVDRLISLSNLFERSVRIPAISVFRHKSQHAWSMGAEGKGRSRPLNRSRSERRLAKLIVLSGVGGDVVSHQRIDYFDRLFKIDRPTLPLPGRQYHKRRVQAETNRRQCRVQGARWRCDRRSPPVWRATPGDERCLQLTRTPMRIRDVCAATPARIIQESMWPAGIARAHEMIAIPRTVESGRFESLPLRDRFVPRQNVVADDSELEAVVPRSFPQIRRSTYPAFRTTGCTSHSCDVIFPADAIAVNRSPRSS